MPDSAAILPDDADGVLKLAAQGLFETLARSATGVMLVDREHRIVWISEGYKRFVPALEHEKSDFVTRARRRKHIRELRIALEQAAPMTDDRQFGAAHFDGVLAAPPAGPGAAEPLPQTVTFAPETAPGGGNPG